MSKYRTALGKTVDMGAMAMKNERVRAVGNMKVNARGDMLDSQNRVIKDSTSRVNESYKQTVNTAAPIVNSSPIVRNNIDFNELNDSEKEFEQDDEEIKK